MKQWLDLGTAIFALGAATFWFLSAYGNLPPLQSYWGSAPPDDPFFIALKSSAKMNTIATVFSGLSALALS